jgi:hypothetical protein
MYDMKHSNLMSKNGGNVFFIKIQPRFLRRFLIFLTKYLEMRDSFMPREKICPLISVQSLDKNLLETKLLSSSY